MSKQIIECVPNISEGRDAQKIKIISSVVENIDGVKLLNVDPGKTTNRTVLVFVSVRLIVSVISVGMYDYLRLSKFCFETLFLRFSTRVSSLPGRNWQVSIKVNFSVKSAESCKS